MSADARDLDELELTANRAGRGVVGTWEERAARRERLLAVEMYLARRRAAERNRSLVCQADVHERCHGGTVCLCECHDPEEQR